MKILRHQIITLLVLVIILGCNSNLNKEQPEIIHIDIKSKNPLSLNIFIKNIKALETNDNSLFGTITDMIKFNNRYYVLDHRQSKSVFVFGNDGNYINKTHIGKGPGEMISPRSITVNRIDSTILVHDQLTYEIFNFDPELNFLFSYPTLSTLIKDFFWLEADSFLVSTIELVQNSTQEDPKFFNYSLYYNKFKSTKHFDIYQDNTKTAVKSLYRSIYSYKDTILFIAPYKNNIYELEKSSYSLKYQIDFGKLGYSGFELKNTSDAEIRRESRSGNRVSFIVSIFYSSKYLSFILPHVRKAHTYIYDRQTKLSYPLRKSIEEKKIPEVLVWGMENDSTFFGIVEPLDLIKFQEVNKQFTNFKVNGSDNPYIIEFAISTK